MKPPGTHTPKINRPETNVIHRIQQLTAYKHNGKQENPSGRKYNIRTKESKYYETHDSLNTSTEKKYHCNIEQNPLQENFLPRHG